MNHSKRVLRFATTALAALTLAIVGCSGPPTGSATTTSATTTIDFSYWASASGNEAVSQAVSNFEKEHPDIKVERIWIQGDIEQKIASLIAGGSQPTVMMVSNGSLPGYAPSFAPTTLNEADFLAPVLTDYMTFQGTAYAVPWVAKSKVMAVNVTMFEKAGIPLPGIDEPMTPEEFRALAVQFRSGTGADATYGSSGLWWDNWVAGFGGSWYNDDATQCTLDTPEALAATNFVIDSIESNYAITPTQIGGGDPVAMFGQGQIAMLPDTGPWNLPILREGVDEWTLVPVPGLGAELEVNGLALAKGATGAEAEAGKTFIEYMTQSQQAQTDISSGADTFDGLPVIESAVPAFVASGTESQNLQEFIDSLSRLVPRVGVKNDQPIRNAIRTKLFAQTGLGTGSEDPAVVLPVVNDECTAQLETLGR